MPEPGAGHLSIGEVLGLLLEEFPDVTISKIRFLESQGLIEPERTPSGYRKFFDDDVELLRRKERVVAVDGLRVAEVARRRDLRQRAVVHEHELEVRLDRVVDFIIGERTSRVALVGTLEIVERREVEGVRRERCDRSRPERRNG